MTVKVVTILAIRIYKQETELKFKLHNQNFQNTYCITVQDVRCRV
jgi:hypothetical protein